MFQFIEHRIFLQLFRNGVKNVDYRNTDTACYKVGIANSFMHMEVIEAT